MIVIPNVLQEIIKLVDKLINLNEKITQTKLETNIDQIKGSVDYCEHRINEIVYQLYGLTENEIKIIEGVIHGTP